MALTAISAATRIPFGVSSLHEPMPLLLQCSIFVALALVLAFVPGLPFRYGFEALALCVICPTATACAVVTGKLGGNMAGVVTYTVLINVADAVLVPLLVPIVHPAAGVSFFSAFISILGKVFPLLILPALTAWAVRFLLPRFHKWLLGFPNLAFYIWSVSLSLAILMSTRAIVHNNSGGSAVLQVFVASLLACVLGWAQDRQEVRVPRLRRAGFRPEEHRFRHVDGLHLLLSGDLGGRRVLQHLAQLL